MITSRFKPTEVLDLLMILWLFFNVLGCVHGQPKQWDLPFPPLGNTSAAELGRPAYVFDGVDYDALPQSIAGSFANEECYREQARCLRYVTQLAPVCAYNYYTAGSDPYIDMCDMEKQNCIEMLKAGKNIYGDTLYDRHIFLQGMGKHCEIDDPSDGKLRHRRSGARDGTQSALVRKIRRYVVTQTMKRLFKLSFNNREV